MTRTFHTASRPRRLGRALGLTAALVLAACGGGGDGSGSGTGSFSSGAISGFGSIVVNHIHYDENTAAIRTDGNQPLDAQQLKLGMVVEINGSKAETGASGQTRATASQIVLRSEIEGPVSAVNAADGSVTVLGQTVRVDQYTVFDEEDFAGRKLEAVQAGDILEVYGFQDAQGNYRASRVERETDPLGHYKLRGTVQGLSTADNSFRIGSIIVDRSALPSIAGLQDGVQVRVLLDPTSGQANRWRATDVRVEASPVIAAAVGLDQLQVELDGIVTAFTNTRSFSVNGILVDASAAAYIPPALGLGSRVELEGTFAQGVLKATEVELDDDPDNEHHYFDLEGPVADLNTVTKTFIIRGVTVAYSGARFHDGGEAQLANGRQVDVEATLAADGSTLAATEIEFDDDAGTPAASADFELDGRITSLNAANKSFVVRGYTVTYANARFEDGTEANLAVGSRVEVDGSLQADGRTVAAREIEFDLD